MASYLSGFTHLEIQLEEIKTATNNFDDSKFIGAGGFGKVYKGELSHPEGKIEVAFKRLDRKHGQGDPEFFKEIRMLSSYKHGNLISLLGYCNEGNEMILMYEYASRGSLERILNDSALTWTQRLKICLGAAMGLSFLHDPKETQQRVLHRDIKSANILLDENLNAKVADFGLSKISPANQDYTFLVTSPAGTHGYCDPLYMDSYQLTKESDVYSFGVVLFEVLCGRVCYENSNGKLKVFVPFWKKCYQQNKLDEIIFPDLKQQMDPISVETFVEIAYQCLEKTREQRPKMSVVVEKLKAALESKELHDLILQRGYEFGEIIRAADPPLIYKSIKKLESRLSRGFTVNGGKSFVSVNDKGQVCERIYIKACLDQIESCGMRDFQSSRFPGGRCYYKHKHDLKVRVRAQFLYPRITYSVNLVFKNDWRQHNMCKTLHYKLDGETKCCMVYDTYKREDGWFVVPLYQFTSHHKTADFEIEFEGFLNSKLYIAGFEFQPLEEKVELQDQGLEVYQDIVKAASQTLFYKSLEELKELLSVGFHINNYETWFSLNEIGQHCEMLSIAHCLISGEGDYSFYYIDLYSRFPLCFKTNKKGFKVHIRTQFLTPLINYTVNLVFRKGKFFDKQKYVALKYKLEGETETSIVYFAIETKDTHSAIAELYQFTSNRRTFDLEIVFKDHKDDLEVEGILFQPLENVKHKQVLEDEKLSDNLRWAFNEEDLCTNLLKWFVDNGQEGYSVDKDEKKCLMLSARGVIRRGVIRRDKLCFKPLPESRFQEVAVITDGDFKIVKKIKRDALTPETTYAIYLVYKSTEEQAVLEIFEYPDNRYIYLVSPHTPIIGQNLDQNTHNQPLIRPKLSALPRQRSDGWMEVKVWVFQTPRTTETIEIDFWLRDPKYKDIRGLIIQSIELRPIAHSA